MDAIRVSNETELKDRAAELRALIEQKGWLVLEPWDNSERALTLAMGIFGVQQDQPWADASGLVPVTAGTYHKGAGSTIRLSKAVEFRAHTDGSYLNGVAIRNGQLLRIGPPKIMLLQVVTQAATGGESYLVDGQRIWSRMQLECPDVARRLSEYRPLSFVQDGRVAAGFPLFERMRNGTLKLRFRSDVLFVESWAKELVDFVVKNYLFNPELEERRKLTPGQILIADNHRVLHARDAFEPGAGEEARLLRRAWIWDDAAGALEGPASSESWIQPGYERLLPKDLPAISGAPKILVGIKESTPQ